LFSHFSEYGLAGRLSKSGDIHLLLDRQLSKIFTRTPALIFDRVFQVRRELRMEGRGRGGIKHPTKVPALNYRWSFTALKKSL